ncbi:J domain-containing protein, partial [Bradyrhizobium sp. PRIMUS42]|nr:J domain-containing protein [Bradyrhizobium sp. PRIMUS42]
MMERLDPRLDSWKLALERLRSAQSADFAEAGRLVAEIARMSTDTMLRQAAEQALPV